MSQSTKEIKFKVNEIFYSIQAEGRNAGRPAVFVRFAGCNLRCPFCDTDHEPYQEMTQAEIEAEVERLDPTPAGEFRAMVVFTGGEPTLQLNLVESPGGMCIRRFRAIETNGIISAPDWIEWVTISPKTVLGARELSFANELKFVKGWFGDDYLVGIGKWAEELGIPCYVQPMADKDGHFVTDSAIEFVKANPYWSLSLQFHKLINMR